VWVRAVKQTEKKDEEKNELREEDKKIINKSPFIPERKRKKRKK